MAGRKLQKEIEMVFKKVDDGVLVFEQIWDKVYSAATAAQKEKYEGDLKKEIKKLQRLRDQIKSWQGDSSIKDKSKLDSYRKLIESKMEKFKVCEKETKTKAFSKEGLALDRTDPKEKAKQDVSDWVADAISKLNDQRDELEAEIESLGTTVKKGKKGGSSADRVAQLQQMMERHNHHADMLEKVLRAVYNETVTPEQVDDIKDGIEYYIDSNREADFIEDDTIYDDLDLDQIPAAATISTKAENEDEVESGELEKGSGSGPANTSSSTVIAKVPPVPAKKVPPKVVSAPEKTDAGRELKVSSAAPSSIPVKAQPTSTAKPPNGSASPIAPVKDGKTLNGNVGPSEAARSPSPPPLAFSMVVKGASAAAAPNAPTSTAASVQQGPKAVPAHPVSALAAETGASLDFGASGSNATSAMRPGLAQGLPVSTASAEVQHERVQPRAVPSVIGPVKSNSTALGGALGAMSGGVAASSKSAFGGPSSDVPTQAATGGAASVFGSRQAGTAGGAAREDTSAQRSHDMALSASALDGAFAFGLPMSMEAELAESRKKDRVSAFAGTSSAQRVSTPACFPQTVPAVFESDAIFSRLGQDTLFFVFYYQPGKYHQYLAAKELKKQSWRFHKKYCTWFQRHDEPRIATEDFEKGNYVYFDYMLKNDLDSGWTQRFKSDFTFEYAFLEDELQ